MFRTIIRRSTAFSYKIECHIADVTDGNSQLHNLEERRAKLQRWRAAWKSVRQHWATGPTTTVDTTGNITFASDGRLLIQQCADTQDVILLRLPSESRGIQAETWRLPHFQFDVDIFCHDSAQDLLIIAEQMWVRVL